MLPRLPMLWIISLQLLRDLLPRVANAILKIIRIFGCCCTVSSMILQNTPSARTKRILPPTSTWISSPSPLICKQLRVFGAYANILNVFQGGRVEAG